MKSVRMLKNTVAQLTVVGLLMVFLGLMVLSALMATIISESTNTSVLLSVAGYAQESVLFNLVPLFIIVVFLATIAMYGGPQT